MPSDFSDLLSCDLSGDFAVLTPLDDNLAHTPAEQQLYDEAACAAYLRLEDAGWWHKHRHRLVESLLTRFSPPSGAVLNVGCGTNLLGRRLADQGYRVAAIDSSHPMLMSRPPHQGVARLHGFAPCREVRANVWDVIIALDLLEHVKDEQKLLTWMRERLKPGGFLILTGPAYQWLSCSYFDSTHYRRYRRGSLIRSLHRAGFDVELSGYLFGFVFPLLLLHRLPWMLRDRLGRGFRPRSGQRPALRVPSSWESTLLGTVCASEFSLAWRGLLPWGSSVFAVARRPV